MNTRSNETTPVIPSRNMVIFPGNTVPMRVGRTRSKAALESASQKGNHVIVVAQKDESQEKDAEGKELFRIGTLCKIEKIQGSTEHGYQVLLRGISRVQIHSYHDSGSFLLAAFDHAQEKNDFDEQTSKAILETTKQLALEILTLIPGDTRQIAHLVDAISELPILVNLCAENLQIPVSKKQELLEHESLKNRVLDLLQHMQNQKESLSLQSEIREKLSSKLGKQQRESLLREQLKAIKTELGEGEELGDATYLQKIEDAQMPQEVKKVAQAEAKRLEATGQHSAESSVIRNYLDLLCGLPWSVSSQDELDLDSARKSLDADHYGLDSIKKRIIQHLAVMKLKKEGKGSILLLVGPPGVGKTSLGQSIAKATGRKFVRASLGGMRDDSEIRGHRRTYVGAMPGRIIQGIKRAGVNNPVMMLDEIDKLGRGYGGDPASALLEVLDPEQNNTFSDHYLDVTFDLSKVFFIATANSLESIPAPLLDRMEVIEVSGYTSAEKMHIAKNHLVPKQMAEYGLTPEQFTIGDDALLRMITHYTREAGVRELQRLVTSVSRYATEKVVDASEKKNAQLSIEAQTNPLVETGNQRMFKVSLANLEEIIGPEKYLHEVAERIVPPGVVTGLAWTPRGGEILFVESSLMPGSGKLILTGQLGEVMKESAQIALSLVRSNLPGLVPGFEYDKKDIHIHVPAGAIPKDGPSAGVTMLTTLASLFSGTVVSPKLAMTGEITLRGAVTPVGGIKEKVLGAHRAGIERIIMSKRNERDLKEVPEEIKSQIKFEFVETVSELLEAALGLKNQFSLDLPCGPLRAGIASGI